MTVTLPTLPHSASSEQRLSSAWQSCDLQPENAQMGSFADLLASLLTSDGQRPSGTGSLSSQQATLAEEHSRHAAAFAPPPGTPVEAFSAARLLVDMALNFPGGEAEALGNGYAPAEGKPYAAPLSARLSCHENGPAKVVLTASAGTDIRALPLFSQAAAPAPQLASGTGVAHSLSRANIGLTATPAGINAVPSHRSSALSPELPQSQGIRALARDPRLSAASGHASPFGAHLAMAEGGLQLILRVPKLTENERVALEAALTRLLESHGHRDTTVVIHEVMKG